MDSTTHLTHGIEDPKDHTPAISLALAYVAMVPTATGAATASMFRSPAIARLTITWAGAVLCFLAGVKRGLSFRQRGGPTVAQIASMFGLFVPGALAVLLPWRIPSLVLLLLSYGSEAVLGPVAARRDEAPRYFARLRPVQMMVPVASLLLLLMSERKRTGKAPSRR